jgi:site-specific DNA-methyltransferase (adenine-specific)
MSDVRLILGDCLKVLPTLNGIDAVVTDPPYGMRWKADRSRFVGGSPETIKKRGTGLSVYPSIHGDDQPFDPSPWLGFPKAILWGCNHFAARLPVGTTLVWLKRNDGAFGSFLSDAELAWMKGGHGVYCIRDLSFHGEKRTKKHPNQKPLPLMRWCLSFLPEGCTVLDPFMGSGTTGVACVQTGRNFIGIEIDPAYFAIAEKRIAAAREDAPLFAANTR